LAGLGDLDRVLRDDGRDEPVPGRSSLRVQTAVRVAVAGRIDPGLVLYKVGVRDS
jgi:hypothetical protein